MRRRRCGRLFRQYRTEIYRGWYRGAECRTLYSPYSAEDKLTSDYGRARRPRSNESAGIVDPTEQPEEGAASDN